MRHRHIHGHCMGIMRVGMHSGLLTAACVRVLAIRCAAQV